MTHHVFKVLHIFSDFFTKNHKCTKAMLNQMCFNSRLWSRQHSSRHILNITVWPIVIHIHLIFCLFIFVHAPCIQSRTVRHNTCSGPRLSLLLEAMLPATGKRWSDGVTCQLFPGKSWTLHLYKNTVIGENSFSSCVMMDKPSLKCSVSKEALIHTETLHCCHKEGLP